jgi:hypothetical protein
MLNQQDVVLSIFDINCETNLGAFYQIVHMLNSCL